MTTSMSEVEFNRMNDHEQDLVEGGQAIDAMKLFCKRTELGMVTAKAEVDRIRCNHKARIRRRLERDTGMTASERRAISKMNDHIQKTLLGNGGGHGQE